MLQLPPAAFPTEKGIQQQERENAVDHLLEDMQRFLPTALEPMTLSAVRDYMVTKYAQAENNGKLVMRHEAIKILIRDVERQLAELTTHAQALSAASNNGGAAAETFLQQYPLSQENFQEAVKLAVEVQARLVVCDSEYMVLHTRMESLEREVQHYKEILPRQARERDRARRKLQETEERTKHIVERVQAELDRSSRATDYLIHQANDLERRLLEMEKLYREAKCSLGRLTRAGPQPGRTSA